MLDLGWLLDLADRWEAEADMYERDGVNGSATLLRRVAQDLRTEGEAWWLEALSLEQAAKERGQAYDTVQRAVRDGRLQNAGRKNKPRVRRCDLFGGSDVTDISNGTDVAHREAAAMEALSTSPRLRG